MTGANSRLPNRSRHRRLGDRPVLVSAGLEGSIRVWDVAVRAHG